MAEVSDNVSESTEGGHPEDILEDNASSDDNQESPAIITDDEIVKRLVSLYHKGNMTRKSLSGVSKIFVAAGHRMPTSARYFYIHVFYS